MMKLGGVYRSCIAVATLALSLSQPAPATANDVDNLKKINNFKILVESIAANDCGITKERVLTSLRFILSQSKIKVQSSSFSYIYLNIITYDDCSGVMISLEVKTPAKIESNNVSTIASVWAGGTLLAGGNDMAARVDNTIERLAKKFVVDWSTANP